MYSSRRESADKLESMTEIFHGKYFPVADSCPLRIDVNRFPVVEEAPQRFSCKRKSITGHQSSGRIILPAIRSQVPSENSTRCLNKHAEQELQELESNYRPSDVRAKNQQFDFTGPSACQTDFDSFSPQSLEVVLERREEKMEESSALKRWEFWMKDKRRMQRYLGNRLQRDSYRLLLQDSDKIRRKLEDRWLSTCTQIPEPDKWRGHPFRWKAEFRLPNRKIRWNDPKVGSPPQYCAIRTSLDKGEIPDTEFIGIPRSVQREKGFVLKHSIEKQCESVHTEDTQYFMTRRGLLKPHDIDMDALEVIGKQIMQPKGSFIKKEEPEVKRSQTMLPEITVHDASEYHKHEEDQSLFCLIIDDEEIRYNVSSHHRRAPSKPFHWKVNFPLNTVGVLAERVLKVENRGTVAIRYQWISERPKKPMNLEKLQPRQYEPWFFFNKNSGFFLPGQIYHLKFYHHSKFSGIRKEVWHLKTEPPLSLSRDPCTVTLSAIATEEFSSINPLETYLLNRVKTSIVENMIDIIIEKALRPCSLRGIEYRSIFSSKMLFEFNNPKRYYNSTIVNGLNKLYEEITPGVADWDLSIDTLVCQVKAQTTGTERKSLLVQVAEKAKLLFKPTYVSDNKDQKYKMTYSILCKMTNFMEEDYRFFRSSISYKVNGDLVPNRGSTYAESSTSANAGELGEFDYYNISDEEIDPITFLFFKTMFYLKVYYRMCQAVEHIAGVLETRKLFEPWKEINFKAGKPRRKTEEHPYISDFADSE